MFVARVAGENAGQHCGDVAKGCRLLHWGASRVPGPYARRLGAADVDLPHGGIHHQDLGEVKKGTSAFASSFLDLHCLQLTGNPSEVAVIQGTLAHSQGVDIYEANRKHQARMDGTEAETWKRK